MKVRRHERKRVPARILREIRQLPTPRPEAWRELERLHTTQPAGSPAPTEDQ